MSDGHGVVVVDCWQAALTLVYTNGHLDLHKNIRVLTNTQTGKIVKVRTTYTTLALMLRDRGCADD